MSFWDTVDPFDITGNRSWKNPADDAMGYMEEMKKVLPQYYQPYIDAGNKALPGLEGGYGSMMNPNEFIKKIGAGYQESPGYQWQKQQGLAGIQNAAAAGGMLGTGQHQQQAGELAGNLANQDFYNYLSKALGTYDKGIAGMQGLYNTGANASMGLGNNLAGIAGGQANLAYEGRNAQNQRSGQMMQMMMQMLPMLMMA